MTQIFAKIHDFDGHVIGEVALNFKFTKHITQDRKMHFSMSKTFKILKYEIRSDAMKTIRFSDKDFKSLKELKNFRKEFAKPVFRKGLFIVFKSYKNRTLS